MRPLKQKRKLIYTFRGKLTNTKAQCSMTGLWQGYGTDAYCQCKHSTKFSGLRLQKFGLGWGTYLICSFYTWKVRELVVVISSASGENALASNTPWLSFFLLPPLSVRSLALSPSNQATLFLIFLSEKNFKFSETIQHNI